MTNEEIRKLGFGELPMNGSYFIEQDFNNDFTANDSEEACEMALDHLMDEARKDEQRKMTGRYFE